MTLVFEDQERFELGALQAGLTGGVLGFVAGALGGPGLLGRHAGLAATTSGVRALDALELGLALLAAAVALGLGAARRARARESGEAVPSRWLLVAAMALAALGGVLAARGLPVLAGEILALLQAFALTRWMPDALATALVLALCGAAYGLWAAVAAAPAHLSRGGEVEERLRALGRTLTAETRPLAERAVAAQREAVALLQARGALGGPLVRAQLEALALLALGLAERASGLAQAATSGQERELLRRRDEVLARLGGASDAGVRASLGRALESQELLLARHQELSTSRERLLARLHAEVAELERARMSLVLLAGAEGEQVATELDLLRERLRAGAEEAEAAAGVETWSRGAQGAGVASPADASPQAGRGPGASVRAVG